MLLLFMCMHIRSSTMSKLLSVENGMRNPRQRRLRQPQAQKPEIAPPPQTREIISAPQHGARLQEEKVLGESLEPVPKIPNRRGATVNPIKLETGLRPNSAGVPYTLLLRIEAMRFPTFGLLL